MQTTTLTLELGAVVLTITQEGEGAVVYFARAGGLDGIAQVTCTDTGPAVTGANINVTTYNGTKASVQELR